MPNRAERRAQKKSNRKGVPAQYDQTQGRARSGMVDEHALQEKSRRLEEHTDGEWKPSAGTVAEDLEDIEIRDPQVVKAPHSARQIFRIISWVLISLSALAFLVIMWLPNHPLWLIATVSGVFVVAVLSLFVVAGDPKHNPNLDANGTAV
ncbi:MAG: tripartite tricarboxylate transporter TctB family protein [Bifidobacterium tibiigranuli]|jgi:hypothetical protein|uniref:tripartite tricarboxylate transporter TctB family protein n=1 Tax=Bifidobacterium tibiigranuli TaxID=2172043 RepID=UPI002354B087|nr:tripartite tricarboxylate transporter TctB family protein [Bifidobacterium tibiigranuli]MCH3974603.1 tripartite tricarboxylate transporter TctB family protein [Bifidobacterium tibiigranuli]MCH4189523.1 tripartite tricarboxylate transporter TctB family protein [Bifidobacterium tibiigranuli]MCH4204345.1 tripartite tricarboxylate transporter TctB family protein [Bifidobacterium tibiigranuli]MCH4275392.1 tripartite tricarboxylate transporter TctB family protein [Bifidobacterium tibiigranuli]MCI